MPVISEEVKAARHAKRMENQRAIRAIAKQAKDLLKQAVVVIREELKV